MPCPVCRFTLIVLLWLDIEHDVHNDKFDIVDKVVGTAVIIPKQNQNAFKKIFLGRFSHFLHKTCKKTRFPAYIWEDFS